MKKTLLLVAMMVTIVAYSQTFITIENQKMLLTRDGVQTVLAPNGDDASYFWASVSPDEKHIVYTTAHLGTYVCDIDGGNVQCMGRMNAPKWMDNNHVAGMQEFYTGHDEIDHIRYISRDIRGRETRDLTAAEQADFIAKETARLADEKARQARRIAARNYAPQAGQDALPMAGIKIYINPGHGGHDANDRSIWTIPIPETWSNPLGYWESNSNLVKGLALRDMLEAAGATIIMSRVTNKSGIRDIEYYPGATPEQLEELRNGDDRDLSAIAEEANANNVDHFISIHSNALNSQTNYLLMLWHGTNDQPTVPLSDQMAASSGNIQITNPLTVWTSPRPLLRGDLTFYGDDMGLGVLRPLTVPGFLSEGSFHDYPPETHRLCNNDYCKLEALRMSQHFYSWFKRQAPQTATISGWCKSANEKVDVLNQPKFTYVKGSDDQWLPLNGVKVELFKGDTKVAEETTDSWYNGVFAFFDLEPGTYTVKATLENYKTVEQTVTVTATEIAGLKLFMKNVHMSPEDFPEPEISVMPLETYTFTPAAEAMACPAGLTRMYYRNGRIFTMEDGKIYNYSTAMDDRQAVVMPDGVTFSDFAFSSDDYIFAKVKDQQLLYMWDDDMLNPTPVEAPTATGNSLAVSGPHWNANIRYTSADNDAAGLQITLTPNGVTTSKTGVAYFRYAKQVYCAGAFALNTEANHSAAFHLQHMAGGIIKDASANYPAEGLGTTPFTYAGVAAWVEGYEIHVIVAATNEGLMHFKTTADPVPNIYAGECRFDNETFSFRLNTDATSVILSIEKDGETTDSHDCGALKKGYHEIANPFGAQAFDAFSVTASAQPISYIVKVSDDSQPFQFYAARGVTVDKTPQSPYFGRIYAAEAVGGLCSEDWGETNPEFRTVTQGIYALGNDFTDVTNQGDLAWNGNVAYGENASASNYQFALSRPAVAPDGDVFVCSSTFTGTGIYIMDAAHPDQDFTPVFQGKLKDMGQVKAGTKVIHNPIMHCYIEGTGEDEVLYTYDRNCALGTVYGCIYRYDIGKGLPWTTVPSATTFNDMNTGSHVQNGSGQMAPDGQGGFFMSQYRFNSSYAVPGLIHVNKAGEVDFNIGNNGVDAVQQGGMAVSVDGSLLALGTELGMVKIWGVTYDNAGVPTLTPKYEINWGNGKGVTMACDFDAAGNLYIISNSNERLMVYSLPNLNNTYTTRVVAHHEGTGLQEVFNQPLNGNGVQKRLINGQLFIIRDGKAYSAQGQVINL